MTALEDALIDLAKVKERMKNAAEEKAEIEEVIVKAMQVSGQKTITANGGDLKGTIVEGSTIVIDADALKKSLTAAQWKKVTKQVLDKEALEAHMVTKDIDATVVAAASTEKDSKPYIRVTGSFRTKKNASATPRAAVATKNSSGGTKPAAKKRVKPKTK